MFKDDIKRTIGTILKENKHKMLPISLHSIYFIKRYSDKLAFYINCVDNRRRNGPITVMLYFTGVTNPDDSIWNFDLGIKIPIVEMYQTIQSNESFKQFSSEDIELADRLLYAAGKKIVDIEESINNEIANTILQEIKKPYYTSLRMKRYQEMINIYDILNEDPQLHNTFNAFKSAYKKIYKKTSLSFDLCGEFIDNLPPNYFQDRGITYKQDTFYNDESKYIKKILNDYLYWQCLLG